MLLFERHFKNGGDPDERTSSLRMVGVYTAKGQLIMNTRPEIYWDKERWYMNGAFSYLYYPDQYYGVGDGDLDKKEEFTRTMVKGVGEIQRRFDKTYGVGVRIQASQGEISDLEKGGLLAAMDADELPGGLFAAGPVLAYDTRDNTFYPTAGGYAKLYWLAYMDRFGGDYAFDYLEADVRRYVPLRNGHVAAFNLYAARAGKEAPFWELPNLGGVKRMRGLYQGRFRDHQVWTLQGEWRKMWGQWGAVAFAAAAGHAGEGEDLFSGDTLSAFGIGGRKRIGEKEPLNVRLDLAAGEGEVNVYFSVAEAF